MPTIYDCLQPISSSMFSRAGFNEDTWELLLEFKSTREIRAYKHISPERADEILSQPSLGKFFNAEIKGNSSWEFDTLGVDPSQQPAPAEEKPKAEEPLGVIDEDIKRVEPGWNGKTIEPMPPFGTPKHVSEELAQLPATPDEALPSKMMHFTEAADYPQDDGHAFQTKDAAMATQPQDVFTGPITVKAPQFNPESFGKDKDGKPLEFRIPEEAFQYVEAVKNAAEFLSGATAITKQTEGEVLGKWQPPTSAAEALDLLAERDGEIRAIIAANVQTGAQALTVKINNADSRLAASETLNRIVAKKESTTAALDPFRAMLYAAYGEAMGKVKSGLDPLEKGINHIKNQIIAWDRAQEQERQRQIQADNERREKEARELQEKEAERIRLADIQDKLDEGDTQGAQTLFDAPPVQTPRPYIPATYIPPAAPKVEGQSTTTAWKVDRSLVEDDETGAAYIASITKLLSFVKNGAYPIDQAAPLLQWDFAKADKLAGALMGAFSVPGLQAAPATTLRVSKGRKKK